MSIDDHILLEDDGLIVVNKPAGMPTAGDELHQPGSLQFELMQEYRRMIWAVHQLDKDTSGVNLFVRRKALVQKWTELLKDGTKRYLAVCEGTFKSTMVDAPLGWISQGVRGVTNNGKASLTEFRFIASSDRLSLVEARLHSGRTHQIRIHAAHAGHPVLGDARYGAADPRIARQALHAWRIEAGGQEFEAPMPDDFAALPFEDSWPQTR